MTRLYETNDQRNKKFQAANEAATRHENRSFKTMTTTPNKAASVTTNDEKARLRAILSAGVGKEKLASVLAFETEMSVEAAVRVLAAAAVAPLEQQVQNPAQTEFERGANDMKALYGGGGLVGAMTPAEHGIPRHTEQAKRWLCRFLGRADHHIARPQQKD